MAPLTKESLETSNHGNESVITRATSAAKPGSGRQRADAVSLEIPIKVHGSRVTEATHGVAQHAEPFEEQTSTMIVFPQGGVLRMSTALSAGQMVILTNLRTRQDAICRVQKVRVFSSMPGYVEVEFTHPQPGYWGVRFPSDASAAVNKAVTPVPFAPAPSEPLRVAENPATAVSWAPAPAAVVPPPAPFTPPSRPESSFISIGSKEKVQSVASTSSEADTFSSVKRETERSPLETVKYGAMIDFPAAPPAAHPPSLSMAELRGDEELAPTRPSEKIPIPEMKQVASETSVEATPSAAISHASFGIPSAGAPLTSAPVATDDDFGTRFGAGLAVSAQESEKPRRNWLLVAACVVGVVAVAGGGAYYYTQHVAGLAQTLSTNRTQAPYSTPVQPSSNAPLASQPVPASGITVTASSMPTTSAKRPDTAFAKSEAAVKQPSSRVTPGMMAATLNAHPIFSQHANADDSNSAPSIDAGEVPASEQAAMPGIIPSSGDSMPAKPAEPVRVGGEIKQGRLISSVIPVYPATARATRIEGDVLIRATIDETGKITNMQVVSGPKVLWQAALDALRQWKYEPATLNGQPTSIQREFTLRFRL